MFRYILLFICSLVVCGCDYTTDLVYSSRAFGHDLYYSDDFSWCESPDDIYMYFTDANIEYKKDVFDNWKNPEQTIEDGGGDCEDFCILFLNILFINTGIKGDVALIDELENSRTIVNGGTINHAVIIIDNCIFDVVGERAFSKTESSKFDIGYIYTFDELF